MPKKSIKKSAKPKPKSKKISTKTTKKKSKVGARKKVTKRSKNARNATSFKDLHSLWLFLTDKGFIVVYKDKSHEVMTSPYKTHSATAKWMGRSSKEAMSDSNVEAVLLSAMSYDSYEQLMKKAKGKSPKYVIDHYKKFFTSQVAKEYFL